MLTKAFQPQTKFPAFIIFIIAAIVGAISMYHHEMWRDESQAFLIIRDSKNLGELWQNVRYEGHPILWYFVLYLCYQLFPSIYIIQVIHLVIGLGVIAAINWYSPFTLFEKFLLTFSYFFSYEYLVISRNYSIGILFMFAAIIVFYRSKNRGSVLPVAVLLGLAANANIYSLIISFWLFLYFLLKGKFDKQKGFFLKENFWPILVFLLLNTVAVLQIIAPEGRTPKVRIAYAVSLKKLDKVFTEISEAMFYLADLKQNEKYWGSNFFNNNFFTNTYFNVFFHHLPVIFSLSLIIVFCFNSKKKRKILLFYLAAFFSLFVFTYMVFDKGFLRHAGAFFILFILAYWIFSEENRKNFKSNILLKRLFVGMLFVQCISAVFVHLRDIQYPFSRAKHAAIFLKETKRDTGKILIQPDFYGMSVVHYATLNKVFYPISESWGSFIKFNSARKPRKIKQIFRMADSVKIETMIFNSKLSDSAVTAFGLESIYSPSYKSTVEGEDFYIYGRKNQ
jgi:hypothetical protein